MNEPAMLQEAPDFSLVLGGPVFQLFRWAHLSGDTMELLKRRIIVIREEPVTTKYQPRADYRREDVEMPEPVR